MTRHVIASLIAAFLSLGCASVIAQEEQQPVTDPGVVNMVPPGMSEAAIVNAIEMAAPSFEMADNTVTTLRTQKTSNSVVFEMVGAQGSKQQMPIPARKAKVPTVKAPSQHTSSSNSGPKWEIEVHGGILEDHQAGSSVALPSAQTYSLTGSGAKGYTSTRVSSWYFGDGATLIGLSSSLDPILGKPVAQPQRQMLGFRASRTLTKRMAAEFTFDRGGRLAITDDALAQVESARTSFYNVWKRLNVPGNTPTTSVSTVSRYGGQQIFTTGAIVISSAKAHRVNPFVTLGAGLLSSSGNTPSVTLVGSYGGPDALETDTVRLTFSQASTHVFTAVFGAGLKIYLSEHLGIRLDARSYLYSNSIVTLLDANHTNTPDAAWIVNASGGTSVPSFQRLIGPGLAAYSTLSGPALSGFKTFYGTGVELKVPITLGFFWRF
jgi:hypothetical protein